MVMMKQIKGAKNRAEMKPKNKANPAFKTGKTGKMSGGKITSGAAKVKVSADVTPMINMTGTPKPSTKVKKGGATKAAMASKVASGNKKPFKNGLSTDAKAFFAKQNKMGLK